MELPENSSSVALKPVVYSSTAEQVFSIFFIGSCATITTVMQSLVLVTIIKSPSLHTVHFYIIATYCFLELLTNSITSPIYIMQFSDGTMDLTLCRSATVLIISIALGSTYHTGLIAFERYLYFCHPYKYSEYMSTPRAAAIMVTGYTISTTMCLTTELVIGREYRASILYCNLPDSPIQSVIQFMVILLPSAIITIFSAVKVWRLTKRAEVAPHQAEAQGTVAPVKQALKALRMVLLLSGTLWGTMIPAYIVRIIVLNSGFTWDDLDTRRYMSPAVAMRVVTFMYSIITSFANPFIYYYSRKDLRQATMKLLRRNRVHPASSATTTGTHGTN